MMKQPLLIIAFVSFFITGCTVIPANKTANIKAHNVYLTQKKPPKSCRYVGEVYGSQGNWFTGMFTSNMDLALGARNSLKNQAAHKHVLTPQSRSPNRQSYRALPHFQQFLQQPLNSLIDTLGLKTPKVL